MVIGNREFFFRIFVGLNIWWIYYIMCFLEFLFDFIWNFGYIYIYIVRKKCVYFIVILFLGVYKFFFKVVNFVIDIGGFYLFEEFFYWK